MLVLLTAQTEIQYVTLENPVENRLTENQKVSASILKSCCTWGICVKKESSKARKHPHSKQYGLQKMDVSVHWKNCITKTSLWLPLLFLEGQCQRPRLQSRLNLLPSLCASKKSWDKVIQQHYFLRPCHFCSTGIATVRVRNTGDHSRNGPFQAHCWYFSFYIAPTDYQRFRY